MKNEQFLSVVYGVFEVEPHVGTHLLGLYFLEGEAEAARDQFISEQVKGLPQSEEHYRENVVVRRLNVGQTPSLDFAL